MTKSIARQLHDSWEKSGLTLEELAKQAKLKLGISSMSRKLSGDQILTTKEAEALAQVLDVNIVWAPDSSGARKGSA